MLGLLQKQIVNNSQFFKGVCLVQPIQNNFAKWSKPKKQNKIKERKSAMAMTDEKSGKIADASKPAAIVDPYKGLPLVKTMDKKIYEHKKNQEELDKLVEEQIYKIEGKRINIAKQRQEELNQKIEQGQTIEVEYTQEEFQKIKEENTFKTPNEFQRRDVTSYGNKVEKHYFNCEDIINKEHYKNMQNVDANINTAKRSGVLAYKVGMTMMWDKWGVCIPLTVLQLDRCQVVQVKTKEKEGYNAVQLGIGQKNLKKLKKSEIGHYLKNDIAPKQHLKEFKVTAENLLPVGFMLNARHFTPGQFVDVTSTSKGKGFAGVMKRWNFSGQGASHGNSISHRVMGSTGQCQDPGRVFKGKKMPGNMGNKRTTVQNMKVYKIDYSRNLVFIKGGVPGTPGTVVEIKDSVKLREKNVNYLNFPTFIPQEGVEYADQVVMLPSLLDPLEVSLHDNDVVE